MNMSEEVTGVTLQVAEKAVTAGVNVTTKLAETIARLFSGFLTGANRKRLRRIGGILILIGLSLMLLSALIKP